ncbi:MAG TPA: prepilin-type N-terminal cleavage/methylation domain-containing protein [Opitutaceae bacterium]|nr:prepilin-type N-terminal cleavage/methylation domain-containing protein [Opitutaceae bacterium]
MTTSTPRTNFPADRRRPTLRARGGLTLVEAMISVALSGMVLAAVLSAFLMIGRTSFNSTSYSQIEAETRRALETFGQDARVARDIRWHDNQTVTLTLPAAAAGTTTPVSYAYDGVAGSPTYQCFYRVASDDPAANPRTVLVRDVTELAFNRFKLEQPGVVANTAANDLETKQLQLTLRSVRRGATTVAASQAALSASYILRNKRVTN